MTFAPGVTVAEGRASKANEHGPERHKGAAMRALIVCVSVSHGNTRRIADAMASVLDAEVREPEQIDPAEISHYDLVGFGSGIFALSHHERLRRFVARLPDATATKAFVFATSGTGFMLNRPLTTPLDRQLADKGYDVVGRFCCPGYDTWFPLRLLGGLNKGRPNETDLAHAAEFAATLCPTVPAPSGSGTRAKAHP